MVKGLVELHGGTVEARSEGIGRGAEFIVRLPLATAPAAAETAPEAPPDRRLRILIIEDNAEAADILREAMEFYAHTVQVAYDGPSGIALARDFLPEVVLCDLGLPGMDGYQVAQTLRADRNLRTTTLIALSGYGQPDDIARARAAGFHHHVIKPPNLASLQTLLLSLAPEPGSLTQ